MVLVAKKRAHADQRGPAADERTSSIAQPEALTAAAGDAPAGLSGGAGARGGAGGVDDGWKQQAWNYYDNVGELRYVCSWLSNALSRCTITGSTVDEETGQPTGTTDDPLVLQTVRDIAGGPAGQAQLFGKIATFLTVPGELWIAIIFPDTGEEWHVLSNDEVRQSQQKTEITLPDGRKHELVEDRDTIVRVHRPHPRKAQESDSPVRAALPILREIVRLGQHVEATAKSRLAGNGLMVLPEEISMPQQRPPSGERPVDPDAPGLPAPRPPEPVNPDDPNGLDNLVTQRVSVGDVMAAFVSVASRAMEDPSSASATIPMMLQAPGEFLDKIKHIKLGTEFTEVVIKLREAATRRLALALDVPPEVLLGTGDMNHWSAWQVEESGIKLHVEPLMAIICDALTEHVLRPLLRLNNHPDPESAVIWYSTAGLALRPNRAGDAKDAYDRMAINGATFREALGFDDSDAFDLTTDDGKAQLILAAGAKNPAMLPQLLEALGVAAVGTLNPPATPPAPGQEEPPQEIPDEPGEIAARVSGVQVAAHAGVQRALERAGNRCRTRTNLSTLEGVARHNTHTRLPAITDSFAALRLIRGWDEVMTDALVECAGTSRKKLGRLVEEKALHALAHRTPMERVTFERADLTAALT